MKWTQYQKATEKETKKIQRLIDKIQTYPENKNRNRWMAQLKSMSNETEWEFYQGWLGIS